MAIIADKPVQLRQAAAETLLISCPAKLKGVASKWGCGSHPVRSCHQGGARAVRLSEWRTEPLKDHPP